MQTLKLSIPGRFYDSQIYSGRLYLWSREGSIITCDWSRLIEGIKIEESLKLVLRYGFLNGNALYSDEFRRFLQDREVQDLLQRRFQRLAETPLEITETQLRRSRIREQDNPFPFPHADTAIHYSQLIVGSQSGVRYAPIGNAEGLSASEPKRIWEGPAKNLATAFHSVAVAAGSEGLFRFSLGGDDGDGGATAVEPTQLDSNHANFVHWMYDGVFSSSYFHRGYLIDFARVLGNARDRQRSTSTARLGTFSADSLFDRSSEGEAFVWGAKDKVYSVAPGEVAVLQYDPKHRAGLLEHLPPDQGKPFFQSLEDMKDFGIRKRFIDRGSVAFQLAPSEVVRAESAPFGVVIEHDEGLLVRSSTDEVQPFDGEPVNWRVYPDSRRYTNQLHVIYDDHVAIHSFTEDYFVNQKTKIFGVRVGE